MSEFFSNLFQPIIHILQFILGGFYTVTSAAGLVSYGYPIILLTILIKVVTYPLTVKQIKSMKAMQEIQPMKSGMMVIMIFICAFISVLVIFCWRYVVAADSTGRM